MIKTLAKQIGQYKTASIMTPLMTALEVVMDVMIPYITASLIDKGINAGNIQQVYYYGALMLGMAFLSLLFGILAGRFSSYASSGFAANLRSAMYKNIQRFAFSDIDKYSNSAHHRPRAFPPAALHRDVSGHRPPPLAHLHRGDGGAGLLALEHHLARCQTLRASVREIRRPERERSGERGGHSGGEGFRAREIREREVCPCRRGAL